MVYSKKYLNLANIFVWRLFKVPANQSTPGLSRDLSSIFW